MLLEADVYRNLLKIRTAVERAGNYGRCRHGVRSGQLSKSDSVRCAAMMVTDFETLGRYLIWL